MLIDSLLALDVPNKEISAIAHIILSINWFKALISILNADTQGLLVKLKLQSGKP